MLLVLLTRILLWAAVGLIIYWVMLRFIPRNLLTWFGGLIVLLSIVLAFLDTSDPTIAVIWRFISFPLTPLGATICLLGSAIREGPKKANGQQVMTAFIVLFLASMPIFSYFIAGQAEQAVQRAYEAQTGLCGEFCPVDIPRADLRTITAMVVLGESSTQTTQVAQPQALVNSSSTFTSILVPRLLYAADLHREMRNLGNSPFMVVTAGPPQQDAASVDKVEEIRQLLADSGVPSDRVRVDSTGMDIHAGVVSLTKYLQERAIEPAGARIMLVAPALSMRRASLAFDQAGYRVVSRPTDFYALQNRPGSLLLIRLSEFVPSVDALALTTRVVNEYLASIYYFLRGWLPGFNVTWNSRVEI